MRKGLWSPDEDEKLKNCIAQHRSGSWSDIARKAGLQRCGKSCRRRWMNHLRPDLKRQKFTPEELKLVAKLHQTLGNKWSEIATYLVGRTDNDVKNLWNTQLKKQSRIVHHEAPFRSKGNDLEGFPFSMDSNFNHMGQLSFEKSKLSTITGSSTHTSLIASSWGSSSINASNFNSQLETQDNMEEKHNVVDRSYNMFLTCKSYEGDHAQMPLINQRAKLEEGLGCALDECPPVDNTDACATPMGCKTQNYSNGGIHCSYQAGDNAQVSLLNQHAKLIERLECSLDECPLIDNAVPMGYTTQNDSNGGTHCSYYFPTNLTSMLVGSIEKEQQLDSHFSSSFNASWEGAGSSNESSTSTILAGDDTCSVSKPSLFELHHKLHFQQGDDNNCHGQDQKDDDGANCISRGESWSSSSCEQWALETLIGTCEKVTWY